MSCGRDFGGGGQGREAPTLPPNPPPKPLKVGGEVGAGFSGSCLTLRGWERGLGGGRAVRPLAPSRRPRKSLSCGLDFGSRAVKLVYARERGGWGRRKLDSIVFYRDYLVAG